MSKPLTIGLVDTHALKFLSHIILASAVEFFFILDGGKICDRLFLSKVWHFVTKIVLTNYEKKVFEITGTIYSNSERSEQFLVKECFFNLFLEISQISKNRTIIVQIGKNYWDLEICRKS